MPASTSSSANQFQPYAASKATWSGGLELAEDAVEVGGAAGDAAAEQDLTLFVEGHDVRALAM